MSGNENNEGEFDHGFAFQLGYDRGLKIKEQDQEKYQKQLIGDTSTYGLGMARGMQDALAKGNAQTTPVSHNKMHPMDQTLKDAILKGGYLVGSQMSRSELRKLYPYLSQNRSPFAVGIINGGYDTMMAKKAAKEQESKNRVVEKSAQARETADEITTRQPQPEKIDYLEGRNEQEDAEYIAKIMQENPYPSPEKNKSEGFIPSDRVGTGPSLSEKQKQELAAWQQQENARTRTRESRQLSQEVERERQQEIRNERMRDYGHRPEHNRRKEIAQEDAQEKTFAQRMMENLQRDRDRDRER